LEGCLWQHLTGQADERRLRTEGKEIEIRKEEREIRKEERGKRDALRFDKQREKS
jgi:hypothetical protein